jgi:uncharacterized protein YkwD
MKAFQPKFVFFLVLFLCAFSVNLFAQTIRSEKTGSVAAYLRDKDEDSGLVRKRVASTENTKIISPARPSASRILELEKMTFALINQKRAENGLEPLTWSDEVARIARLHSENMVRYKFFSHKGIDGKMVDDRADSIGMTKWTLIGENIAYNRGYQSPCETAVEKWLLSPGHRQNLLNNRWKETAVGIAVTDDGTYFFTQVFIKRR